MGIDVFGFKSCVHDSVCASTIVLLGVRILLIVSLAWYTAIDVVAGGTRQRDLISVPFSTFRSDAIDVGHFYFSKTPQCLERLWFLLEGVTDSVLENFVSRPNVRGDDWSQLGQLTCRDWRRLE